jgi:hypothetical protein
MIKITLLLALVASITAFAESANARSNDNYSYSSRDGCMYKGYPCSEWTRPDSY